MSPRSTILIVAPPSDVGVRAAARGAAALAPDLAVQVWSAADLALLRWSHRTGPGGGARTTLTWRGQLLEDRDIAVVWFRERSLLSPVVSARWSDADRDYADSELRALWVSFLCSLGPRVVNCVDGTSPAGPSWSRFQWLAKAREAGLPLAKSALATSARLVPEWRGSPYDARRPLRRIEGDALGRIAVLDGQAPKGPYQQALSALGSATGCGFLEVSLAGTPDGGAGVFSVDPLGSLQRGAEVDAAATMLVKRARQAHASQATGV